MTDAGDAASPARGRTAFLVLARVVNALYFLLTSTYCILTYSSFAYQQFIRPRLVDSLTSFVIWHHLWHWVALGLTALTLIPELQRQRGRGPWMAWVYLTAMTAVGIVVLVRPILPSVENDALGLRLAFLFLLPPLWLALHDHLSTTAAFRPLPGDERRLVVSGLATGGFVWAIHVGSAPWRTQNLGDLPLSLTVFLFGATVSLLVHLGLFGGLTLFTATVLRVVRRRGGASAEYWAIATLAGGGTLLVVARVVFASLSFRGTSAWALAAVLSAALTTAWSGIARRLTVDGYRPSSAFEAWWSPFARSSHPSSRRSTAIVLLLIPFAAFVAMQRVATFDWDFLVQNLLVLVVWTLGAACLHDALRPKGGHLKTLPLALALGVLLMAGVARGPASSALDTGMARSSFVPEFALDAYAAVDPSYRLIRHLLWVEPQGSARFYGRLRANSLIEHVDVAPIDVDFVAPLEKAPVRPPNIFLFVIDSLRRDYVSAYNPAVTFTPSMAQFAADNDKFLRHFSRYGGTGLSMPAIWAGGMLLHKEYVLPFRRMNALEKLLNVNGYRSILSLDHITAQIIEPALPVEVLDRGRDEMQYDFCATLDQLRSTLATGRFDGTPVFAHTRSLNLHVSKLTGRNVSTQAVHDGFQGPAAAAVSRMDRCFGGFIAFLKSSGRYDDSIVILTSDHGDSLGEAMRWGHSYTLFPEILQTPLLVHVPSRLRDTLVADTDAMSFSTDLTPSLYALLGYTPKSPGWAYGSPLFVPSGTDQSWRRRQRVLVASSYGPVYGIVEDNGRSVYIADGVNTRDYAYDLSGPHPVRVGITSQRRAEGRSFIEHHLRELATMYHFTPQE